jgi:hypothetical protein
MLRTVPALLTALALIGLATPALADTNCNALGSGPDISVHFGGPHSEADETEYAEMQLRSMGINATQVERWGGCYRAFVTEGGHTRMEYFNARTFEPVDF